MLKKTPENHKTVLEWLKKESVNLLTDEETGRVDEKLLWELWSDARAIISEFNCYGGGDDEDENDCFDYLSQIQELLAEGNISNETKRMMMDEIFEEYNIGNSGFGDSLIDLCYMLCDTKEEWQYLVKKLGEKPSDWRTTLIMGIQKNQLQDEETYLKMRTKDLRFGMDYWDLVEFYNKKGEREKAVETAEIGLEKGEGRLTELFLFLFAHYATNRDKENLERVVQHALKKKHDEQDMLDRLFEYYKKECDYENAKRALLKTFEYVEGMGYLPKGRAYQRYKKTKEFLTETDWNQVEPEIFQQIRNTDTEDYIRICLDKGLKQEAVHILLLSLQKQPGVRFVFLAEENFDEFADRLKEEFPEDITMYYWQKAYRNIHNGNRSTYRIAVQYFKKAKQIFIKILEKETLWNERIAAVRIEFKQRRAFIEEARSL
ncbi:MAG: hypothetical protein HYZ34_01185 [Ignavibacteriae bacterium]|nr:hypothetical protein [Ignavibacteriota bacterium]